LSLCSISALRVEKVNGGVEWNFKYSSLRSLECVYLTFKYQKYDSSIGRNVLFFKLNRPYRKICPGKPVRMAIFGRFAGHMVPRRQFSVILSIFSVCIYATWFRTEKSENLKGQ
jgi:hypothetical protein